AGSGRTAADYAAEYVDNRDDEGKARFPHSDDAAEPEEHALLVLRDDASRHRQSDHRQHGYHHDDDHESVHGVSSLSAAGPARMNDCGAELSGPGRRRPPALAVPPPGSMWRAGRRRK